MKRFLKKRWLGLPIGIITVALLVCLLAGGTLAATGAFRVFTSTTEVTVQECVEVTEIQAPGWFWDWHTPEVPAVLQDIYPGMDLGVAGWGGKYFIHNISPQPIKVTVTVTESNGQAEWYGLRGCYSTTGHLGHDTCAYDDPICWTNPGVVHTCTFILGSTDYVYDELIAEGKTTADIQELLSEGNSNSAMFFVEAKIKDDANLVDPLSFTLTVDRGE